MSDATKTPVYSAEPSFGHATGWESISQERLKDLEALSRSSKQPIIDIAKEQGISAEHVYNAIREKPNKDALDIAILTGAEAERIMLEKFAEIQKSHNGQTR